MTEGVCPIQTQNVLRMKTGFVQIAIEKGKKKWLMKLRIYHQHWTSVVHIYESLWCHCHIVIYENQSIICFHENLLLLLFDNNMRESAVCLCIHSETPIWQPRRQSIPPSSNYISHFFSYIFLSHRLWYSKDDYCLYMLFEYVVGGELFTYLRNAGRFSTQTCEYKPNCVSHFRFLLSENFWWSFSWIFVHSVELVNRNSMKVTHADLVRSKIITVDLCVSQTEYFLQTIKCIFIHC